jgi:hypothetical protein
MIAYADFFDKQKRITFPGLDCGAVVTFLWKFVGI